MFPLRRPSKPFYVPERCSPSRVRFAPPNYGAPLTAARRSGQLVIATGGSGGNMTQSHGTKNQHLGPQKGLTRRSISDWERANASDQSAPVHDDIEVFQCLSMHLSLRRYALFRPARNPYRGATLLP